MLYHYENQLIGDYDAAETEEGLLSLILYGKKPDNP
jgi:hypothetical protein